jgi:hypothetical protein
MYAPGALMAQHVFFKNQTERTVALLFLCKVSRRLRVVTSRPRCSVMAATDVKSEVLAAIGKLNFETTVHSPVFYNLNKLFPVPYNM